jgi:hypothetical protein
VLDAQRAGQRQGMGSEIGQYGKAMLARIRFARTLTTALALAFAFALALVLTHARVEAAIS